ncbi:hypothetical protein M1116_04415 [Patescibacteria group bacterium]|nr:hypothetical protein [Patescibacteria group bacterium]
MQKSTVIKIAIPVVAALVIIESVVVLNNLTAKTKVPVQSPEEVEVASGAKNPVVTPKVTEAPQADMVFEVQNKSMKQGQGYPVSLNMTTRKNYQIDSFDVYVKYDPTAFEVSNLTFDPKLGKPTFSKVSSNTGLLVANIYLSSPKGLAVNANQDVLKLMGFTVTPKKTGVFNFEVNTGNGRGESATMMVENGTAKVIPFSSNPLEVNVSK